MILMFEVNLETIGVFLILCISVRITNFFTSSCVCAICAFLQKATIADCRLRPEAFRLCFDYFSV